MAEVNTDGLKLIDIFGDAWKLYHEIDVSSEPSSSKTLQDSIKDAISKISFLSKSVEQLSMFSNNEELDEIPTSDLRYLLLPALTANLTSRQQCDISNRFELVKASLHYYTNFLKFCLSYNIGCMSEIENALKDKINPKESTAVQSRPDLQTMNAMREAKIAKFRKAKLQAQQIKDLESKLHDEEIARKYWLLQIDSWVEKAIEDISSYRMEMEMLENMKNVPRNEIKETKPTAQKTSKPFIITKDKLQAAVFGAGYPSLPTVTLEEYFNQEVAAGRLPDQPAVPATTKQSDDAGSDDEDDEEKVKKQREFDDWKDTHRRGAGNRKNMG